MDQLIALLIVLCATLSFGAGTPSGRATVTTFAGSGTPGVLDGSRLQAQFIFPAALAVDRAGNVYVADAGAQRIRVVGTNGYVRTLAGSGDATDHGLYVFGGFRDGPASQALFNTPSGIAVSGDGVVYVADLNNGRVRRITPDGTVSTLAVLERPNALTLDDAGNIYVADRVLGIRRISPAGAVTPLFPQIQHPFAVAVLGGGWPPRLLVTAPDGVFVVGGNGGVARLPKLMESGRPIGDPYDVAMLDGGSWVSSDTRTHTVRYTHDLMSLVLAGDPTEDAFDGGGYRDGPSDGSLFDDPLGIATQADGAILIADAGNRRIRRIRGFDRREFIAARLWQNLHRLIAAVASRTAAVLSSWDATPSTTEPAAQPEPTSSATRELQIEPSHLLPPPRRDKRTYRILYVGDSVVWWNTDSWGSIPDIVERDIALHDAIRETRPVRLIAVRLPGVSIDALASYVEAIADAGTVDAVVLQLNEGSTAEGEPQKWMPQTTAALRGARAGLDAAHVPLLVVVNPLPLELGPSEDAWTKLVEDAPAPAYLEREAAWRTVLSDAGGPTLNLWPAFFTEIRSPSHRPLFSTDDAHVSLHGRELMGHAIASKLLQLHPWTPKGS